MLHLGLTGNERKIGNANNYHIYTAAKSANNAKHRPAITNAKQPILISIFHPMSSRSP
jgi:hypothetical protein